MKHNFDACLAHSLAHEGCWSDHKADPGGATMKGITLATYRAWKGKSATKQDLRNISDAEVAAIYRAWYWQPMRCDDLPAGLDLVAFDAAINSGPSRSAKWLQSALGVAVDGRVGPATVAAANAAVTSTAIKAACAKRMTFLKGLRTWPTFGKGWSRRVNEVEAAALAMTRVAIAPVPSPATSTSIIAAILKLLTSIFGAKK